MQIYLAKNSQIMPNWVFLPLNLVPSVHTESFSFDTESGQMLMFLLKIDDLFFGAINFSFNIFQGEFLFFQRVPETLQSLIWKKEKCNV